jgi:large subunit ribosomal protein L4
MPTVNVQSPEGELSRSVELPESVFDVQVNVPLLHQVVVAQLAAARQGTASTKTRGEVRGGGRKPYRQKGTGRARQGSLRAPQFAGGGVVHGPTPRDYAQRTPKKMKAAALRSALSDRARSGRVHVVSALVEGVAPSTKIAANALKRIVDTRHVLVVIERDDALTWKSLRNVPTVHVIRPDQLNTYDVLVSDDVVFTEGALAAFLAGGKSADAFAEPGHEQVLADAVETLAAQPAEAPAPRRRTTKAAAAEEAPAVSDTPATDAGETKPAGDGVSDEQAVQQVAEQTSSDLLAEDVFEREADGASTDEPVAEATADDAAAGDA